MTTLLHILKLSKKKLSQFLSEIPQSCWDVLIKWFFEFKTNNIYGNAFYKLMNHAFKFSDDINVSGLLSKMTLLPKMLDTVAEFCQNGVMKPDLQSQNFVFNAKRICFSLSTALSVITLICSMNSSLNNRKEKISLALKNWYKKVRAGRNSNSALDSSQTL